jgi:hypothetical protein
MLANLPTKTEFQKEERFKNAQTKGFFINRAADRGRDHPDHRRYRYS